MLRVEPLEGRDLLATYLWVGPAGGSASAGANWRETMSSTTGVVPGTSDYALFHPALGGADTNCVFTANFSVNRVTMHSSYTQTLTVNNGVAVTASALFDQYGSLVLNGGTVTSGGWFYMNGPVTATPGGSGASSAINAATGLALNDTLSVTGGTTTTPGLVITCNNIDAADDITIGVSGGATGTLGIDGDFKALSTAPIALSTGSNLLFVAGTTASTFLVQSTLTMSGATITTNKPLTIDASTGVLHSLASGTTVDTINGALTVSNGAVANVGSPTAASTLNLNGDLAVNSTAVMNLHFGALLDFSGAPSGTDVTIAGQLNLYGASLITNTSTVAAIDVASGGVLLSLAGTGSDTITGDLSVSGALNLGNATGGTSNVLLTGNLEVTSGGSATLYGGAVLTATGYGVTVAGGLNLYGATLSLGTGTLSLNGGTLTTYGGSTGGADTIGGTVNNNGTITWAGSMHTLSVGSIVYNQSSSGTLEMRIRNPTGVGPSSDLLDITGSAILGGTLIVTAVGTLPLVNTWVIIQASSGFTGDFTTKTLPTLRAAGINPLNQNQYIVT